MTIEWHEDHLIADGVRYGLTCDWRPWYTPLPIPDCLIATHEGHVRSWEGRQLTDWRTGDTEAAWRVREQERRDLIAAEIKAKNARGLERMKEKHAGQKYDRKLKIWVRVNEELSEPTGEENVV